MKTIKIEPKGHFYLNNHAISEFVTGYEVESKEIVTVRLRGKIEVVEDGAETEEASEVPETAEEESEVKDGNR